MAPRTAALSFAAATALALAPAALAGDEMGHGPARPPPSPVLERVKRLAGEWQGTGRAPGDPKTFPTVAVVKVVSAGSAVMLVTDPGGAHEMVTVFHADDGAVLATHYCAAQNQPRMKATAASTPDRLVFEFVDGTNLKAFPGRMQRLVLAFPDENRHVEEWVFREPSGEEKSMIFEMARKG